jgi:hypothetical protein
MGLGTSWECAQCTSENPAAESVCGACEAVNPATCLSFVITGADADDTEPVFDPDAGGYRLKARQCPKGSWDAIRTCRNGCAAPHFMLTPRFHFEREFRRVGLPSPFGIVVHP